MEFLGFRITRTARSTEPELAVEPTIPLVAIEKLLEAAGTSLSNVTEQVSTKAIGLNNQADELDNTADQEIAVANDEYHKGLALLQNQFNVSLTQATVKKSQAQKGHLAAQSLYEALNAIPTAQH